MWSLSVLELSGALRHGEDGIEDLVVGHPGNVWRVDNVVSDRNAALLAAGRSRRASFNTSCPFPSRGERIRLGGCGGKPAVIVFSGRVRNVDTDLSAARVRCPVCDGPLRPWGHARARVVRRSPGSQPRWWRPRRAWCPDCASTHVLLPAELLPRRRDSVDVVGAALLAHAGGAGHRRIATNLGRPAATVRNWLRSFARHAERLRVIGTVGYAQLDPLHSPVTPAGSPSADAVEALAQAARAAIQRFGPYDTPWAIINVITAGRLLTSPSRT